jgi:hypothetical protein
MAAMPRESAYDPQKRIALLRVASECRAQRGAACREERTGATWLVCRAYRRWARAGCRRAGVSGLRLLVVGFWLLVSGFWFLVSGCQLEI